MKLFTASVLLLLLCGPALASPAPSESFKVRVALRDGATTRTFDVSVAANGPCATAREKTTEREVDLKACVSSVGNLDIDWFTRSARGEFHSTSSITLAHGATAELGPADGPRFNVTVQ